jgi:FtsZ-interacting cell division protein ZipA
MDRTLLIVIAVAAIAVILIAIWAMQRRRSAQLKQRFGPEYDQALRQHHDARTAERELDARERRVAKFEIHPLGRDDGIHFREAWRQTQIRFVDNPRGAVTDADRLVTEVMRARGYPIGDFEQRAADISVDHPRVVSNYRAARAIAERHARGQSSTEDLRQAVVHYRQLFAELLEIQEEPMTRTAGGRR